MEHLVNIGSVASKRPPLDSNLGAANSHASSFTSTAIAMNRRGNGREEQKRLKGAGQPLTFIMCGAPSDAQSTAARREVRSQAAKRSAEQRKATIAARPAGQSLPRRSHHASSEGPHTRRRTARSPPQMKGATDAQPYWPVDNSPLPRYPAKSVEALSLCRHNERDEMLGVNLPALVGRYLDAAFSMLDATAAKYATRVLSPHTLACSFFSGTLTYMGRALLAAEEQAPPCNQVLSRSLVLWMRHHMLVAINEAIATGTCPDDHLAAAVAVAAGWESQFGDPEMCDVHFRAFRDIVVSNRFICAATQHTGHLSEESTPALSTTGSWSPGLSSIESPGPVTPPQQLRNAWIKTEDSLFQQRITEDALAAVYQPFFTD